MEIKENKSPESTSVKSTEVKINLDRDRGSSNIFWGRSTEFLMSCISVSVGLGNIWRFPLAAYKNGGGAFLIPYTIMFDLVGKPIFFLEMALGQFTSKGSVKALTIFPAMKGVAIGQQIAATCVITYYCSLITLALFFLVKSFAAELPWADCNQKWENDTIFCIPSRLCFPDVCDNISTNHANQTGMCSSELYFIREVINQKDDISDGIGWPNDEMIPWLILSWTSVFLVIVKNVKSSGKFSYFLAIFPYVVLVILLFRAVTLKSAWEGIKFFIIPDFEKLLDPQVWYHATTQVLFSLSVGQGQIIMLSSHNHFDHNIHRDTMIITSLDAFTSLIAGFAIFGILGNLAYNSLEEDIGKVIESGAFSVPFISYPDAIAKFRFIPQVFSVLFFVMMFVLGLGGTFALQSNIAVNVRQFVRNYGRTLEFWQVAAICCSIGCLVSFIYITPGGQWMLALVDHFGANFVIFTLTILQLVGVMWVYGVENFCWDVEFMLKREVSTYWRISWFVVAPFLMIIVFIYSMVKFENPTYMMKEFPTSCIVFGWALFMFGVSQVFIWAAWMVASRSKEDRKESTLKYLFKVDEAWGPESPKLREQWKLFKQEKLEKRNMKALGHSKLKQIVWMLLKKYE